MHLCEQQLWKAALPPVPQGGRKSGHEYARSHFLSDSTLDMVADMRWQFASMLADIQFVIGGPKGRSGGENGRDWVGDVRQPWNTHAADPAVVRPDS